MIKFSYHNFLCMCVSDRINSISIFRFCVIFIKRLKKKYSIKSLLVEDRDVCVGVQGEDYKLLLLP